jgi:peptide/nickel transport system permease protein
LSTSKARLEENHASALAQTWRAFIASPTGVAAGVVFVILVALAIVGPIVWGDPATHLDIFNGRRSPSWQHLLGTDPAGRDILARVVVATRLSLGMGLAGAMISAVIGIPIGIAVAVAGPRLRDVGGRLIDLWLSFPYLLVVIFLSAVVANVGTLSALFAVGLAGAPRLARVTNTLATSIGGREYILAASAAGIGGPRVLLRHVLPNIAEALCISVFGLVGSSIIGFSSLSFLGIGVQPPAFDWGQLLTLGVQDIYATPLAAMAPGVMIAAAGVASGYLGEGLAHALNPLLWTASRGQARADSPTLAGFRDPVPDYSATDRSAEEVLVVDGLTVRLPMDGRLVPVVDSVTFGVARGEIVGIVGESGSGKTMTALAISGLVPFTATVSARRLELNRHSTLSGGRERERIFAAGLGMIFQDPMSSLNPALRIGTQLKEGARHSRGIGSGAVTDRAIQRLREVHVSVPELRLRQYPHELSGGMRQRVMIAMALMNEPSLIIADEPTSSIDVTIQAQIVALLEEINRSRHASIVLISHDIALVSSICSRVLVMYAGRIVEEISARGLAAGEAAHPYTRMLLSAVPDLSRSREEPLVNVPGQSPDFANLPAGCPFNKRCPLAVDKCSRDRPELFPIRTFNTRAACWVAQDAVQ